jgi:hypothetical protein
MSDTSKLCSFTPSELLVTRILEEKGVTPLSHMLSETIVDWNLILEAATEEIGRVITGLMYSMAESLAYTKRTSHILGMHNAFEGSTLKALLYRLNASTPFSDTCMTLLYTEMREGAGEHAIYGTSWQLRSGNDHSLILERT